MTKIFKWLTSLAFLGILATNASAQQIERWGRFVVPMQNSTYSGNPFELEVDATFTHSESGTTIRLPGYYAGNDVWKVAFMPNLEGDWSYVTSSSDADLDGRTGQLQATPASLPGFLARDPGNPKKWKFSDGDHIVPIALRIEFFVEDSTAQQFEDAADFLASNEIHMMETRLTDEKELGSRTDYIFEGDWQNHMFDLQNWDRLEQRMDALTERGLGAHVFFYSDDAGLPGWSGQSSTEALVIRYYVARLAAYPVLLINFGTDISEFRSNSDIQWWGQQVAALDPYDHPISSRRGGGSGSVALNNRTFDSRGHTTADIDVFLDYYNQTAVPVSMDDAWGENRGSHSAKDHRPQDIRRAFWKAMIAGGLGGLVRGGGDGLPSTGFFSIKQVESDLESEQWLRHINPFIANQLGATFGDMEPEGSLASGEGAYALADDQRSRILYYQIGPDDRYDGGSRDINLNLDAETGTWSGRWFDTRTAQFTSAGSYQGGNNYTETTPTADDWALLLTRADDSTPPSAVSDLQVLSTSPTSITVQWSSATDAESGISEYLIYVDGVEIDSTGNTTYSATGLTPSTSYEIGVVAINGAGMSGQQASLSASTDAATDTTPPSQATNLTVTGTAATSISISWDPASDAESGVSSYNVYLDGSSIDSTTNLAYTASGLSPVTNYVISVNAVNGAGLEGPAVSTSATTEATEDSTPPSEIRNLSVSGTTEQSVTLDWDAATDSESGIAEYRIYRDNNLEASTSSTSYRVENLAASTNYVFEVSAVNGEGLEGNRISTSATTEAATTGGDNSPTDSRSGGSGGFDLLFLLFLFAEAIRRLRSSSLTLMVRKVS